MDADFTANGIDPVEYRAVSVAAKAWLRETGKSERGDPDIVRRDRASAAVFLEALTRKGFKCVDASGKPISRTVPEPASQRSAVVGCGALVAVVAGAGLFFSGTFGGGGDRPAPVQVANQAASCDLPKCVDAQRAGIVVHGLDGSTLIKKQPANPDYLRSIATALPAMERRDSYEPVKDFKARIAGQFNNWSLGNMKPDTQMLVKAGDRASGTYDSDKGYMTLHGTDRPSTATIGSIRHSDTTTDPNTPQGIKVRQEKTSSESLFFVNTAPMSMSKRETSCSIDYQRSTVGKNIGFPMKPDDARSVAGRLRYYYVVSFTAPKSAKGRAWCYAGSDSAETAMLIPGGLYRNESRTNYIHVYLHKLIVSDGQRVFWTKTYD